MKTQPIMDLAKPGGMLMIRSLMGPSIMACRCSQTASTWRPGMKRVPGSSTSQACSTNARSEASAAAFSWRKTPGRCPRDLLAPQGRSCLRLCLRLQDLALQFFQLVDGQELAQRDCGWSYGNCGLDYGPDLPLLEFCGGLLLVCPQFGEERHQAGVDLIYRQGQCAALILADE